LRQGEDTASVIDRLKRDNFVGLYVSATRLLDSPDKKYTHAIRVLDPFVRLWMAYGLAAARALQHLEWISRELVMPQSYKRIAEALEDYLSAPNKSLTGVSSFYDLEYRIVELQIQLNRTPEHFRLTAHPSTAFPHLAAAVKSCSKMWADSQVLFLLDDVSTRYLKDSELAPLFSNLLFQESDCAFKFTSESQTIYLSAPGENEQARIGRDYSMFDLGSEVYDRVRERGNAGIKFVEDILQQRARFISRHPRVSPSNVLGRATLVSIAEQIVKTRNEKEGGKRNVYHGINALRNACVGDIGDLIALYELMLDKWSPPELPISAQDQSSSFRLFCARRLYDLSRRDKDLSDFATTFARAAYQQLIYSDHERRAPGALRRQLREYAHVHLTIRESDPPEILEKVRALVDAGVFVMTGGTPRFREKDGAPEQQIKLTFRKIYGLVEFMSLGGRDRFELSGDNMRKWLLDPETRLEVLVSGRILRNDAEPAPEDEIVYEIPGSSATTSQLGLDTVTGWASPMEDLSAGRSTLASVPRSPKIELISFKNLHQAGIKCAVIGLGFEERTPESARRLVKNATFDKVLYISYPIPGKTKEIREIVDPRADAKEVLSHLSFVGPINGGLPNELSRFSDPIVVDITGIPKSIFFSIIRTELSRKGIVYVCHTKAEYHHPTDEEVLSVMTGDVINDLYESIKTKVPMGEWGDYTISELLYSDADQSRGRVLCAFASPKRERLHTLLERNFDRLELVVPNSDRPRARYARMIAELGPSQSLGARVTPINTDDIFRVMEFLIERYQYWYVSQGMNFEIGLTGSKMQALASAILASMYKISQCWTVRPEHIDPERYSKGYDRTSSCYKISIIP